MEYLLHKTFNFAVQSKADLLYALLTSVAAVIKEIYLYFFLLKCSLILLPIIFLDTIYLIIWKIYLLILKTDFKIGITFLNCLGR